MGINLGLMMNDQSQDVAIIGAGLAGLSAAIHLKSAGRSVTVHEANSYVGGRVSTEEHEGFLLDRGFQILLTAYPECKRILDYDELRLRDFENGVLIHHQGDIDRVTNPVNHPLSLFKLLFSSSLTLKDIYSLHVLHKNLSKTSYEKLMLEEECNAITSLKNDGFSQKIIDGFFKPFLGSVLLDRSLLTSGKMANFLLKMFFEGPAALPSKGMQMIPKQLASKLDSGTIHLNKKAVRITSSNEITFEDQTKLKAKTILLATDQRSTAKLLDLPLPSQGRGVINLHYAAEKSPLKEPILFFNGEDHGPINHLAVLSDVASTYAPSGAALISATVLDSQMHLSDENVNEAALQQLNRWFGAQVKKWRLLKIYRIQNAHPSAYPDRMWHTLEPFKIREGLYACGDYLEMPTINSALSSGRRAAEEIVR